MTTFEPRPPLQTLGMASSQRPSRRRSARNVFDDDDAPPAKRAKTDENQVNGHINRAGGRKKKQSYDEEDNGFMFKRTRSKQPAEATVPIESEPPPAGVKPPEPAPPKRKRKSFSSPLAADVKTVQEPRRSKRLSGDKAPDPSTPAQLKIKRRETVAPKPVPAAAKESSESPQVVGEDLQVEKRNGTKIALPFADTPVQNRNKQMREKAAGKQKNRRSSSGIRGRRASSLLDSGTSNALPHADVETRDFYKHIDQNLPEQHRMRHLLTWCGARALPDKVLGTTRHPNETLAVDAARHIQEELLKDFNGKAEMSQWFNREDTAPTVLVKKPNPRNIQNAAKLQELELEIARLQGEKATWEKMLSSSSTPSQSLRPDSKDPIDAALLDPSQTSILETLKASEALPSTLAARLQKITSELEPQVDAFADGVHHMAQYRVAAERVADRLLSSAAEKLEEREQKVREAAGTTSMGAREVLSALAGVLNRQER